VGELNDKIKGNVNEAAGKLKQRSNDPDKRSEGEAQEVRGQGPAVRRQGQGRARRRYLKRRAEKWLPVFREKLCDTTGAASVI
jgi:uncharacterized protein YjbJ (UPF0337 family)